MGVWADPWCFISPNDPEFLKSSLYSVGVWPARRFWNTTEGKIRGVSSSNTPEIQTFRGVSKFRGVSNLGCMTLTISRWTSHNSCWNYPKLKVRVKRQRELNASSTCSKRDVFLWVKKFLHGKSNVHGRKDYCNSTWGRMLLADKDQLMKFDSAEAKLFRLRYLHSI